MLVQKRGIQVLKSLPYVHQQNGRAERFNRTIMDKAQTLRLDACLPPSWWEFAVLHALHLYNRTLLHRPSWWTPFEGIHKSKPSIDHLRVFGCGGYVYLPDTVRKNKLSLKAELMIFLGYQDGMKGYKFMRLHNNAIFMGTTAVFDEALFPKCEKNPRAPRHTIIGDTPPTDDEMPGPPHGALPPGSEDPPNGSNPIPLEAGVQTPRTPTPTQ